MSGLSSFFPSKFLSSSMNSRDRPPESISHLRFFLETMPGQKIRFQFRYTRAEVLSELYDAFWGPILISFFPPAQVAMPAHMLLSEIQAELGYQGAGKDEPIVPGRPCSHVFKKGESCFRCKDCTLDDSCVLYHEGHNPGGCCDCGDEEAWRRPIGCPFHPPAPDSEKDPPRMYTKPFPTISRPWPIMLTARLSRPSCATPCAAPSRARSTLYSTRSTCRRMSRPAANEADLRLQPSGDPLLKFILRYSVERRQAFVRGDHDTHGDARPASRRGGARVVATGVDSTHLLEIAHSLSQIDLGVTMRRAHDTFREQVVGVITEWLLDLTRSRLVQDTLVLREVLAKELLAQARTKLMHHAEIPNRTRIDCLFLDHTKLWKRPRLALKETYAAILSVSRDHKLAIAGHFANVYHRVVDAYLLYFALQLFTVPSASAHIVRNHKLVSRILAIISAFFTNQIADKRIVYPPHPLGALDVEAFPFKSKRFMPVFSDLRYLCHTAPVQALIASHREYISQFARTCALFMCVNPNKRAASAHVEYETDAWISVFNVTLSLSRVIKERLDRTKFEQVEFHQVVFGERAFDVVKFDLFKHVGGLDATALREAGYSSVREIIVRQASEQAVLTIIDFPLRGNSCDDRPIRTGLWVRNGFAIRGQLLHYRDFMLRELCYDQDLFVLQTALIILPPDTVFVSILDRFGLMGTSPARRCTRTTKAPSSRTWSRSSYTFSSSSWASVPLPRVGVRGAVRREIVHALAVGACAFTDLVKRVAERLVDDVCFEAVLSEVARFRAPDGTADRRIRAARRGDVERILLARLRRTTGVAEPVLVPKPLGISDGPFVALQAGGERGLMQVLFYALHNVLVITEEGGAAPPSAEAILDQALHLIMLALVERPAEFSRLAVRETFERGKTLVDVVCTLEHHAMYRTYRARSAWVLGEMEKHVPEAVRSRRTSEAGKKRATAKARQEALLRQMKAQQASFADTFDDGSDEEDAGMDDTEESEDLTAARPFGNLGMVQPSRFIRPSLDRTIPGVPGTAFPPPQAEARDAKAGASPNFEGFPAQFTRFGLHASVCSHMMHLDCFQVYSASIRQRHRAQATRNHPESIPRKEAWGNVILPVFPPAPTTLVRSKPDPLLDSLQFRNGTGEFVFWSAQDSGYSTVMRGTDRWEGTESAKMVDTELIGYTICAIEISQRGLDASGGGLVVDNLSEAHTGMIRGLLTCLGKLAGLHFKGRVDEGREAVKQAIIKRLLPEWSRTSLTSFSYPLLLRDPFTVLVETAAVAPEMLRHVLILAYYACLARTVIGLVYVLNKTRSHSTTPLGRRAHEDIFGDVRMFFMSVHTATLVFETFGEARIEKLLYAFTLPFLRRAAILCRSVLPSCFPTPPSPGGDVCEYNRLLTLLNVPALSDLPNQDTLQNALSGWCAHYGHSHAASQLNCGVVLDFPSMYRLARLPLVLDNLFGAQDRALTCARCGGAIGVYFLVKRCMLLYVYSNNGTFSPPPYLDAHGEVDISMRRGRRQYLHFARWEEVRKTWLSHGIPTVIARRLEASLDSARRRHRRRHPFLRSRLWLRLLLRLRDLFRFLLRLLLRLRLSRILPPPLLPGLRLWSAAAVGNASARRTGCAGAGAGASRCAVSGAAAVVAAPVGGPPRGGGERERLRDGERRRSGEERRRRRVGGLRLSRPPR
ncbi:hypothetical protein B0H14DRAFT_3598370 [Mycena olivaceomarginata]|nr:hypothetical protein B0H14DRAFT_3598370 [Mycena olivaceomarginata]